MVLTRSERNRLLALGFDEHTIMNMENVPATSTTSMITMTAPITSVASVPAAITTALVMTPAVQQSISRAGSFSMSGDLQGADTSISTPEYSSITARNEVQQIGQDMPLLQPPRSAEAGPNADLRGSPPLAHQLREVQRSLQEIARTLGQQQAQAATANYGAPAQAHPQPGTRANYFGEAPGNNPYTQHFRPVRAPQFAQEFGPNSSPFDIPREYPLPPSSRVDLSKWGLRFDGTSKSMSAEDFMFRLDVLRQDYGCSFNEVLRNFHLLLEGQALDWYWNMRKLTPLRGWQDLETAFLTQYRRFESEFQVQKRIMDRRQLPQESFEDFYNAVIRLRNQQRNPYSEKELVEIMRSNLKPALSHLLFSVRISSLNEFCQQAKRAESLLCNQRQQYPPRAFPAQRVSELAYDEDILPNVNREIEALSVSSGYTCWNCRQPGHSFIDCPSPNRRVFCFRCGRDNVVTPKCPKCQGNLERNKSHPGQTRSTQT